MSLVIEAGNQGSVARSACSTLPLSTSTTRTGPAAKARLAVRDATTKAPRRTTRLAAMRVSSMDRRPFSDRHVAPRRAGGSVESEKTSWLGRINELPGTGEVVQHTLSSPGIEWQERGKPRPSPRSDAAL